MSVKLSLHEARRLALETLAEAEKRQSEAYAADAARYSEEEPQISLISTINLPRWKPRIFANLRQHCKSR